MTEAFLFQNQISSIPGFRASWIPRLRDVDVLGDREFALANLAPHHDRIISEDFPGVATRHHAEQVHGNGVEIVSKTRSESLFTHPGADGLITDLENELLAIYVADCAAIYLADPVKRAIALLHSGKKGTEQNILKIAVNQMIVAYGTNPADLIGVLSPCIRPPDYDIDFAATIREQANNLGIVNFQDAGLNTASDLTNNYSYRIEKGRTGRMLALLSIR